MIKLIMNPCYDELLSLSAAARRSVKLCAPYVKANIVADIFNIMQSNVSVDLITKVNLKDYHSKASDVDALRQALRIGGRVFNCSNLHAKVYIFDGSNCVITSGNLTTSGFKVNEECGVLTDEAMIVSSAESFFSAIINRDDVGRISESNVSEIERLLSMLPPVRHIEYPGLDLHATADGNLLAIAENLSGWKREVFLALGQFSETFTSSEVSVMASQLRDKYPGNNNREAKIRQILQQLRDLGLIEFSSPGVYKRLWN
jgi:phosphatidylserine/phosphatidylglycerophosphate/cardiolipin synthase-like enzyme